MARSYNAAIATPTEVRADFPAEPASAGQARRFVDATLRGWRCDHILDTATLLVSELVSNAILHARTSIRVVIRPLGDRIRIEVHDGDSRAPTRKHYSSLASTGRGLQLVERMSDDWGFAADDDGKRVWFELERSAGRPPPLAGLDFPITLEDWEDLPLGTEAQRGDSGTGTAGAAEPQLRSRIRVGRR